MSKCLNCPNAGKYAFCNLGQDSQSFLDLNSVRMDYPRGSILFREGDCCHAIFVMCSGKAKVSATSREGRTMILKIAETGDVLGMSAAVANCDYEVTVEALEPCQVRVLPVKYLTQMLQQYSDVSMGIAKTLAKDYRAAFDEARLIALSGSPAGRLARLILDWAADVKEKSPGSFVTMSLTHDELASMTATTRETVTRTLGRFRKEKIIATHGIALKVLQPAILEQISTC
jgi:CRP/FNR family transcriptional regulator, cyclic AMP receptor protein